MTTASKLVTAEDLLAMPQGEHSELIAGEVVMMTPAGWKHGRIAVKISTLLENHSAKKGLGLVLSGEAGFVISRDPDTVRAPDVAFVRQDRQPATSSGYFPGVPDLAVEVISPIDRLVDVDSKTEAWLTAGTGMVWVVWPDTRSIVVHRAGQPPRILHEQDLIRGEDVLPGFECRVGECFGL